MDDRNRKITENGISTPTHQEVSQSLDLRKGAPINSLRPIVKPSTSQGPKPANKPVNTKPGDRKK